MFIIIIIIIIIIIRPRNSWMQEVTTGMGERRIGDLEWVDREGWRKKINLLEAQKDVEK